MSSNTYKLTYFNGRGRAELVRLLFAYKDIKFEDERINTNDWPTVKPLLPFGQLPVLKVNDTVLAQSLAFTRYVARELDLVGKDNLEAAKCDMFVEQLADVFVSFNPYKYHMESLQEKKEAMMSELSQSLPPILEKFSSFLKENGGKQLVGESITWADIAFSQAISELQTVKPSVLSNFPELQELVSTIQDLPGIKEWIEKRPKTLF